MQTREKIRVIDDFEGNNPPIGYHYEEENLVSSSMKCSNCECTVYIFKLIFLIKQNTSIH